MLMISQINVLIFIFFADDITIFFSHPNIENHINRINDKLEEVSHWLKASKLSDQI